MAISAPNVIEEISNSPKETPNKDGLNILKNLIFYIVYNSSLNQGFEHI